MAVRPYTYFTHTSTTSQNFPQLVPFALSAPITLLNIMLRLAWYTFTKVSWDMLPLCSESTFYLEYPQTSDWTHGVSSQHSSKQMPNAQFGY